MKILFIIILFIIPHGIFGQNYTAYYDGINQGKLQVIEGNLSKGLNSYYQTFQKYDFVFARDCYHAIEIAVAANDTTLLPYFIKRAIRQGITLKQLLAANLLTKYQDSHFLKDIQTVKDSLENEYKQAINWEIRDEIIDMFAKDQAMRKRYYDSFLKRSKIGNQWEALNHQQVKRMIEITQQYGFPGEKLIGVDTKDMHEKVNTYNLSAGMPIVIFIHHFSQPNPSYDSLLSEQVKSGHLYNEHFVTICDFEAKFGKGKYTNNGYYAFKHSPKELPAHQYKEKRRKIGLLSIAEIQQLFRKRLLTPFWERLY